MTAPLDLVAQDAAEAAACVLRTPAPETWRVWRVNPTRPARRQFMGTATDAMGLVALEHAARTQRPEWAVVVEHHVGGAS